MILDTNKKEKSLLHAPEMLDTIDKDRQETNLTKTKKVLYLVKSLQAKVAVIKCPFETTRAFFYTFLEKQE
jgi:hypothetical protein